MTAVAEPWLRESSQGAFHAHIECVLPGRDCLLDDGRQARVAASCLLAPQSGDYVCGVELRGMCYVTDVLEQADPCVLTLGGTHVDKLRLVTRVCEVLATEAISLHAGRDCSLAAAKGAVSLSGNRIVALAADSLIQSARHAFTRAQHVFLDASQLLQSRGQRQVITASKELKVDAELIQMG